MITVIAGTNRAGSNSLKVASAVVRMYESLGEDVRLLDLAGMPAGVLDPGVYRSKPEGFERDFVEPVLKADGLVLVVPEYNGSYPGVLKLFIDLLPFPEAFDGRPVAYIGLSAGRSGGVRPVEHLQQVFAYRNAHNFNRRVFIASAGNGVFGDDGQLIDGELSCRLEEQAREFQRFARQLSPLAGGTSGG